MNRTRWAAVSIATVFVIGAMVGLVGASSLHAGAPSNLAGPRAGEGAPPTIGHAGPHPNPVPANWAEATPTVSGHYWVGSVWGANKATVDSYQISTQIHVPDSNPAIAPGGTDEFYYVLLSAFDNNGSYDQIGFSDDFGTWGLTYSYTYTTAGTGTGCEGTLNYVYSPDILTLTEGAVYTFDMNFFTAYPGYMDFFVYQGANVLEDFSVYTGGTAFVNEETDCGYLGTTDYEEVYYSQQGVPDGNMHFVGGFYDGTDVMSQLSLPFNTGSYLPVTVENSGGAVVIGNADSSIGFYGTSTDVVVSSVDAASFTTYLSFNAIGSPGDVQVCLFDDDGVDWTAYWTTSLGGGSGYFKPSAVGSATVYLESGLTPNTAYQADFYVYVGGTTSGSCTGDVYGILTITAYLE